MYVDAAAVALVLIYGLMGFHYGLTGALINLAGMIGGYVAAIYYAHDAGVMLAARFGLTPLLALPIASLAIFLIVTRAFYLLHVLVRKLIEGDKKAPTALMTLDRIGGLGFGLVKGALIVGFLLWSLPSLLGSSQFARDAGLAESQLAGLVKVGIETVVRWGAGLMTDDPNFPGVLAKSVADPRAQLQQVANFATNPRLKAVVSDPAVAAQIKTQGVMAVLESPSFPKFLEDPGVQISLKEMGFQTPVGKDDLSRSLKTMNAKLMSQVDAAKNSKSATELQAMLADPAVQEKLKAGKLTEVLNDPRLNQILGFASQPPSGAPAPDGH